MTPEALAILYAYTYWAFDLVWACIVQLTDDQFTEHIDYSVGSIRHHVVHVMSSTRRWMARIRGAGADLPPHLRFEDYATPSATKAQWDALRGDVLRYTGSLSQHQLDETVRWEIPGRGWRQDNHRWELLLHVANHATDHRAQILAVLHEHFGVTTPEQDMILYLLERGAPARPAWPPVAPGEERTP